MFHHNVCGYSWRIEPVEVEGGRRQSFEKEITTGETVLAKPFSGLRRGPQHLIQTLQHAGKPRFA